MPVKNIPVNNIKKIIDVDETWVVSVLNKIKSDAVYNDVFIYYLYKKPEKYSEVFTIFAKKLEYLNENEVINFDKQMLYNLIWERFSTTDMIWSELIYPVINFITDQNNILYIIGICIVTYCIYEKFTHNNIDNESILESSIQLAKDNNNRIIIDQNPEVKMNDILEYLPQYQSNWSLITSNINTWHTSEFLKALSSEIVYNEWFNLVLFSIPLILLVVYQHNILKFIKR